MARGDNTDTAFIVSTHGSPLTQLTSGAGHGKIKFMKNGDATAVFSAAAITAAKVGVTGIVLPLHGEPLETFVGDDVLTHGNNLNIIGDPNVSEYSLTSGDLFDSDSDWSEKDGGAQKFLNAILDGAYRGYASGVSQSSGLNSMTVTRGDLSLASTAINDGTGIVNTYTRSYTVNFKYYQSGTINVSGALNPANPDIADDNSGGVPF